MNFITQTLQQTTLALSMLTQHIGNATSLPPPPQPLQCKKSKNKEQRKKELHALFEVLIEYEDDYSRTLIGLSLCSWNANGILSKINKFKLFVEKYSPGIILVQETKLRPIHNIRIANYTCYRNDRVAEGHATGGGTLTLIKNSINHFNPPTPRLQYSEATIVTINPPNFNPLTIISIYIPPSFDNRLFTHLTLKT
ncbi:hypothetical protein TNCV_3474911 [Trichonephila clavipes]|nr:hypothetical protein TNCV_3474911 [Trichonephila clavipes]